MENIKLCLGREGSREVAMIGMAEQILRDDQNQKQEKDVGAEEVKSSWASGMWPASSTNRHFHLGMCPKYLRMWNLEVMCSK